MNDAIQSQQEVDRTMELLQSLATTGVKTRYYTSNSTLVPNDVTSAEDSPITRWADFCVEPMRFATIGASEYKIVDPVQTKLDAMEARMADLEARMVEATNKAYDMQSKLQQSEYMRDALMFRISQLEQKGYNEAAKEAYDRANYNDMITRIAQMERRAEPYWGSGQITCAQTTSIPSTPSVGSGTIVWPAARSATSSMTWADIAGTSSMSVSASTIAEASIKASGQAVLGCGIEDYQQFYKDIMSTGKSE